MSRTRTLGAVVGGIATIGLASACLAPNQHTLGSISASHAGSAHVDRIVFTFQQGAPTASSARYLTVAPSGPSGLPVQLDGARFVQVDLTPAVAHDGRGDATAAQAVYFPGVTTNVLEARQYEDFEGHVGYALGLRSIVPGTHPTVSRTASTVEVDVPTG